MKNLLSNKHFSLTFCLVLIITSFLLFSAMENAIAEQKSVLLKVATHMPPAYGDAFYSLKRIADYINLHGRKYNLSAEFSHSEAIYKATEILPASISGTLDIGTQAGPYMEGSIPALGVAALPFIWKDFYAEREAGRRGTPYFNFLDREFAKRGLVLLSVSALGPQEFLCNKPIRKLEDWKGIKFRVAGTADAKSVQLLGAAPISMPSPEIYTSLQRGVVNAVQGLDNTFASRRLYEVAKYQIDLGAFTMNWCIFINQKKFQSLSEEQKKVVLNAGEVAGHDISVSETYGGFMGMRSFLEHKGVEQIYLSKEEITRHKKALEPVKEWWRKQVGEALGDEGIKAALVSQNEELPKWGKLDLVLPE